jgi:thiamine biosynthesis lipoprotein ApbE
MQVNHAAHRPRSYAGESLATAAFLLGAEAGLALLESTPGVEGTLMTDAGSILATTGMALLCDLPGSVWAALQSL